MVKPDNLGKALVIAAFLSLAMQGIALLEGSGWVQTINLGFIVFILLSAIYPAIVLHNIRITSYTTPDDPQVGRPTSITIITNRPCIVSLPRSTQSIYARRDRSDHQRYRAVLSWTPNRRGKTNYIEIQLSYNGPLGLFRWKSTRRLLYAPAIWVAPPPLNSTDRSLDDPFQDLGLERPIVSPPLVRPYIYGDPMSRVHWALSASQGRLMVRPRPPRGSIDITIRLPDDPREADYAASKALTACTKILDAGRSIQLTTYQEDGKITSTIISHQPLRWHLARAL